ncbi:MAG: hypothetical protein ABSA41_08745, partial [Terriglobia bacterium]
MPCQAELATVIKLKLPEFGRYRTGLSEKKLAAHGRVETCDGRKQCDRGLAGPAAEMVKRLLESRGCVGRADILVEVKFGEGRYHENLGGEFREELRNTTDEFGKLKASECPRQLDLSVELRKGNPSP